MLAAGQVALSHLTLGLLHKGAHRLHAGRALHGLARVDVAVAGGRPGGAHAEQHQLAPARGGCARPDSFQETRRVAHHVVGGHDQDQGVGVLPGRGEGGDGHRGRRVARHGLEDRLAERHAQLAQLLGHGEAVGHVGHRDQRREHRRVRPAQRRLLQERALAREPQQLLGPRLPRQGPQARARASAHQHGMDARVGHGCPLAGEG